MTRREWAIMLGSACSPSFPSDAIEALVDMLALLQDWPDEAFCVETVKDIASRKRRQSCPAYDEIVAVFAERRLERLPAHVRMGGSHPVAGLIDHPTYEKTEADCARVAEIVAEVNAEAEADRAARPEQKVQPSYATKLQLAISDIMRGVPVDRLRPDLRRAIDEYPNQREVQAFVASVRSGSAGVAHGGMHAG